MSAAKHLKGAISAFQTKSEAFPTIGIGVDLEPWQILRGILESNFRHVVQKSGPSFDEEVRAAKNMCADPAGFFKNPVGSILGPKGALERFSREFSASAKKTELLGELEDFLDGLKGVRAIREDSLVIADEFFTNASKNAWAKGAALFEGKPERDGSIEFFAACDQERLVLGCRDSFGELEPNAVLLRILKCYEEGVAGNIRQGKGGAGIGSFMAFDACIAYYLAVAPGRSSIVCATLPLSTSRKARTGLSKNIHVIG